MEYLILAGIGIVMGLFGGLLGIGGSIVMIPAMVLVFGLGGEKQHLYQAAAMICNFFVAGAATIAHKKAKMLMPSVIKILVPAAVTGVIVGVALSNSPCFAGPRSHYLTRIFGLFTLYVAIYNAAKLLRKTQSQQIENIANVNHSLPLTILTGLVTGITAGLLGIGGGTVCVPLQQILLKIPLKRAISNSAATIILMAVIGATLKNATLAAHGFSPIDSIQKAAIIIPTAILGGFAGAKLVHLLPKNIVRTIFVCLMLLVSYRMLTATPAG